LHSQIRSTFRLSQPLGGLRPPVPCGLVSCRWHSWGYPLQSFSLWRSRNAFRRPLPSCRQPRGLHPTVRCARSIVSSVAFRSDVPFAAPGKRSPRRPTTGFNSSPESVCLWLALSSSPGPRCSPGVQSSTGSRADQALNNCLQHPPPMSFRSSSLPGAASGSNLVRRPSLRSL